MDILVELRQYPKNKYSSMLENHKEIMFELLKKDTSR